MQALVSYFFNGFNRQRQTLLFRRALYALLVIKSVYWLCFYNVLFGSNSIFLTKPYPITQLRDLAFVLYSHATPDLPVYFIIAVLVLSCINLVTSKFSFLTDVLLWFLVVNLHNLIYSALTGGNYLLNHFLFFNCFLAARYESKAGWQHSLKPVLHNFAVVAIIIQVCLVYFLSALAKLGDAAWMDGTALLHVSGIRHFSLYSLVLPSFLALFLNYVVLIYQLSFPVLVWFKKIKKPLILIGISMHIYIAFVMGLVEFGGVMIVAYVYFWPPEELLTTERDRGQNDFQ